MAIDEVIVCSPGDYQSPDDEEKSLRETITAEGPPKEDIWVTDDVIHNTSLLSISATTSPQNGLYQPKQNSIGITPSMTF